MGDVVFLGHARASSTAATIPKRAGFGRFPRASRAVEKAKKNSAGILPRERQLLTADAPTPTKPPAFALPPTASMISPTVSSMPSDTSRTVESSRVHIPGIHTDCEQWPDTAMISKRDFQLAVAWRLRVARKALGKTQADFAEKLNVGDTAISNYESNGRGFTPYAAYRLKDAFGIPLEWLYAGDEGALSGNLAKQVTATEAEMKAEEAQKRKRRPRSA